jgi:hypothetical protein
MAQGVAVRAAALSWKRLSVWSVSGIDPMPLLISDGSSNREIAPKHQSSVGCLRHEQESMISRRIRGSRQERRQLRIR